MNIQTKSYTDPKTGITRSPYTATPAKYKYHGIYDNIHAHFAEVATKPALIEVGSSYTLSYGELGHLVARVAYNLSQNGVTDSHTMALFLPNCVISVVIQLAIWRLGATLSYINILSKPNELQKYLLVSHTDFLFADGDRIEAALSVISSTKVKKIFSLNPHPELTSYEDLLADIPKDCFAPLTPKRRADDVILILFSSGTTGVPKAVELTNRQLVCGWNEAGTACGFYGESIIVYQPFSHLFALGNWVFGLGFGRTVYVMTSFNLEVYIKAVQDGKVTHLQLVPPVMVMIAKSPLLQKYDWRNVQCISAGAAPVTKELQLLMKEKLGPSVIIKQVYGMTEVSLLTLAANPDRAPMIPNTPLGSVGYPIPGVELKVVDLNTGETLPPHQEGELCARSDNFMKGYLGNPKETASTVDKDNWLHTGDISYYEGSGNFFIVDRLKELIKYKGYQVSPSELEGILLEHPDIDDVGVTSVPDVMAGELPQAWVVLKPGHNQTAEGIQKFVADKAAPYKQLKGGVLLVDAIPKTASGKILHRTMKEIAWERARKKNSKL